MTTQQCRDAYAANRASARKHGFTGNFKDACRRFLRGSNTPQAWVSASDAVAEWHEPDPECSVEQ